MQRLHRAGPLCGLLAVLAVGTAAQATPFATSVVSFDSGGGAQPGYDDPSTSLGAPSRLTGGPSDVTVFNTPYQASEVVSIGEAGHLTVAFDAPVWDDPLNPFGVDLLVFGNAFFTVDFGDLTITGIAEEPAAISVSQNGVDFVSVATLADSLFPTQGWLDTSDPFGGFGGFNDGTIPTNFLLPVDPALGIADFLGLDYAQALALYAGSGGGAGIDLAGTGLDWIQYVRIDGISGGAEIDAFADVAAAPEPSFGLLLAVGLLAIARRARG